MSLKPGMNEYKIPIRNKVAKTKSANIDNCLFLLALTLYSDLFPVDFFGLFQVAVTVSSFNLENVYFVFYEALTLLG